jgi:hypothetical protein
MGYKRREGAGHQSQWRGGGEFVGEGRGSGAVTVGVGLLEEGMVSWWCREEGDDLSVIFFSFYIYIF